MTQPTTGTEVQPARAAQPEAKDVVNHPEHYSQDVFKCRSCHAKIECIDISELFSFNLGNAIKYIWRASDKKAFIQDLQKAVWYLNRAIENQAGKFHDADLNKG